MKNVEIVCHLTEFSNIEELDLEDKRLIHEAKSAVNNAYAPYSKFNVGAAVLLDNGVIVKGSNQENASYPLGLCAERVAIFSASATYPGVPVRAVAVAAKSELFDVDNAVPPCGACRQVIAEYEHLYKNDIKIIMSGESGKVMIAESMKKLLPLQFNGDDLKPKTI
jgi:cytidine deaminase